MKSLPLQYSYLLPLDGGPYHIETSPLIWKSIDWFLQHRVETSVMKKFRISPFLPLLLLVMNCFYETMDRRNCITSHFVKSVSIWSYSRPHFPAFRLNTERYSVFLDIQSECGKCGPE